MPPTCASSSARRCFGPETGTRRSSRRETAPNLLDCVTTLEFRSADQWRAYCQQNGLPIADKIDARSVHALNECYAQGIATDHPLYAAYRKATLLRNDEDALKALQSITRLNPSDANAAAELMRLDGKVLQGRLQHLEDALAGSTPEVIVAEVEAIEAFGFRGKPAGDSWCKAQANRCNALLGEAEGMRAASKWAEALSKLDLICRLEAEYKLVLPPNILQRITEVEKRAAVSRTRTSATGSSNPWSGNFITPSIRAKRRTQ